MAFNISTEAGGGDFLPYIKYDAKAGRMFRIDRTQQTDGSWTKDETEVAPGVQFILDFATIEEGWISFEGQPAFAVVPVGQPIPQRPGEQFKQGVRCLLYSQKAFGGVRTFASTAKAVLGQLDNLHTQYVAAPESKQGMAPVVQFDGVTVIKTKGPKGETTNYAPRLQIVKWVPRPAELAAVKPQETVQTPPAQPAQRPAAQHVEAPPPVAQPQPAMADNGAEF